MLDLAPDLELHNHGLRKTLDLRILLESMKIILPLLFIASALFFHSRIVSESMQIGYEKQRLCDHEKEALDYQRQLNVLEQRRKDREWLEANNHKMDIVLRAD
jgi:hypothetical protein